MKIWSLFLLQVLFCLCLSTQGFHNSENINSQQHRGLRSAEGKESDQDSSPDFGFSEEIEVIGPSVFPKPSDVAKTSVSDDIVVAIKPRLGEHHPEKDAIIAFASEYPVKNYVVFIRSLRENGYTGDIVLSVSEIDLKDSETKAFLESDPAVVVYVPEIICFNAEREAVGSIKGGSRTCSTHHLFGRRQANGTVTPLLDPRSPRTVANTRYEIYWTMVVNYNPDSWILVVDARDTVFQSNPFADVPRTTDPTKKSGLLYFFGENANATRIGKSKFNTKWITNAYGEVVAQHLKDKPIICSGASMGEQVAMEAYVRALVNEGDETGTVLTGSDQGFHNRLYYSRKLAGAHQIHAIVVFDQGTGVVNNMGALRDSPLESWGNGKILHEIIDGNSKRYEIRNWDGTKRCVFQTPSSNFLSFCFIVSNLTHFTLAAPLYINTIGTRF